MAEPPYKRVRRPDSKQMWDESNRRAPIPSRERDEHRDRRDDRDGRDRDRGSRDGGKGGRDRDRERDRRYRSRSPRNGRESRTGRDKDRARGGRRDDGDRREERGSGRDERGGRRREDDRNGAARGGDYRESERDTRDKPRERSRSRDRRRSRSPRLERDVRRDTVKEREKEREPERPVSRIAEEEVTKSRTATPPVSFSIGRATSYEAQDHDRMETDEDTKPLKIKGGKAKKVRLPEPEEDPEIIVEDGSMAAMQAMMGFGGFSTTQNKKVAGNDISAVRKEKKSEYRQYMNRVGGFNRPLSPSHD